MISSTSIITAIKGASLATQISVGIGAVAVVAGGTVGTVAIVNHVNDKTPETQVVSSDNVPSEPTNTETEKAEEPKNNQDEAEQTPSEDTPTASDNTQKPSNATTPTQPSNNSASKPSTPTAQPSQPSQPTQPTKKPDYNLNDKYVAGSTTYPFYNYDQNTDACVVAEEKAIFGVTKFTGDYSDLWNAHRSQYMAHVNAKGYDVMHCSGLGSAPMTWEEAVAQGIALDEAKCAEYGLSCGRW